MKTFIPNSDDFTAYTAVIEAADFDEGDYSSIVVPFCGHCKGALNMVSPGKRVILADSDQGLIYLVDAAIRFRTGFIEMVENYDQIKMATGLAGRLARPRPACKTREKVLERAYDKLLSFGTFDKRATANGVSNFERRLEGGRVVCGDWLDTLSSVRQHDFVLIEPPKGFDHTHLAALVRGLPCAWVVVAHTGNESHWGWADGRRIKTRDVFTRKQV